MTWSLNIPSWNFNTHPELSDEQFVYTAASIYIGQPPSYFYNWGNPAGAWISWETEYIQQNGRYAWFTAFCNFYPGGNSSDSWFYNLPNWTWVVVLPVGAITAAIMLWRAWGKGLWQSVTKESGNGGRL